MSEFKQNGLFQYKLKLKWKAKKRRQKAQQNKSIRLVLFIPFRCCFAALYRFLYRQWNKGNYSTPFPKCFSLFSEKNSLSKTFLVECVRSGAASCNKKREFWRETHTPLWLLIGRIIFLTREKTSSAILIGHIIFFTCENHRLLLWLARTNLRTKIYDIAFRWVFLGMYMINVIIYLFSIYLIYWWQFEFCRARDFSLFSFRIIISNFLFSK